MGLGSVHGTVLVIGAAGLCRIVHAGTSEVYSDGFERKTPLEFGLHNMCEDFRGRPTSGAVSS